MITRDAAPKYRQITIGKMPGVEVNIQQIDEARSDASTREALAGQIEDLLANMRSTAGSRFAAAKRLEKRDRSLTSLTAFASAYIIVLTVLPYILHTPPNLSDRINLATVAIATVILVASLLQYSSRDVLNAEQYHRSALELKELRREIKAVQFSIDSRKFLEYSAQYSRILEKYAINHEDIDYLRYKLENASSFGIGEWGERFGWAKLAFTNSRSDLSWLLLTILCLSLGYYALNQNEVQQVSSGGQNTVTDASR